MKKFNLGVVVFTKRIGYLMEGNPQTHNDIIKSLRRHQRGDWGNLCEEDKRANDFAVENGERILSSYIIGENKVKIWIITEWDRSYTTILLPEEY